MTCRQTTPLQLAARMEKVQDNMAVFTTQQIPERPSIRDYKNLKIPL